MEAADADLNPGVEKRPGQINRTRKLVGLDAVFDGRTTTAQEVEHGKPAPDLFLFAAARMGAKPERCVVIEDSVAGVTGANAATLEHVEEAVARLRRHTDLPIGIGFGIRSAEHALVGVHQLERVEDRCPSDGRSDLAIAAGPCAPSAGSA